MEQPVGNSLLASVKAHISEPARLAKAASTLTSIASALAKGKDFPFEGLSKEEAADLELLLADLLATLKAKAPAKPETALRKARAAEKKLLAEAQNALNLAMLWQKHIRVTDTEKGPIIVVEPKGLNSESFKEFAALESLGWRVSMDDRFAPHLPGDPVCALLRPPRQPRAKSK